MIEISVIVPVYNVEKYLKRCLDSILAQSFSDFELILVDDGSTDSSGLICDELAKTDNRISVQHYPNQGVSAARNHGIDTAKGGWIAFIDSDDYLLPDYLLSLYQGALKLGSDFVMTGIKHVFENNPEKVIVREWPEIVVKRDDLDVLYDKNILQYQKGPVIKLFKKEIIKKNGLCFNERLSRGEDALFVYEYLLHSNVISVAPGANYIYNRREGSLLSQRLASYEAELYAYECMKPIILQLLDQADIKHPYPKQYLVYWFDRVLNSIYSPDFDYDRKTRIRYLKSLDYKYYKTWKNPVSWKDSFKKSLLITKHFSLLDCLMKKL